MSEDVYQNRFRSAHQCSSGHRKEVLSSSECGCFYCISIFVPAEIEEWVDEDKDGEGQTALCPKCGIDSVIASDSGYPITRDFLSGMHEVWFA
ncbi:hypothetical protein DB347_24460 [Opitutaceae bacterium EW11]|nr:hypothetical protein DB347_24460 [Opitutaceae bacterium EW11]